jgi:hypothetical protein
MIVLCLTMVCPDMRKLRSRSQDTLCSRASQTIHEDPNTWRVTCDKGWRIRWEALKDFQDIQRMVISAPHPHEFSCIVVFLLIVPHLDPSLNLHWILLYSRVQGRFPSISSISSSIVRVRVGAITRGPLERDYPYYLNFLPPSSKILYKLTNYYNPTKPKTETANLLPSLNHKPGQN